ncbi:MAG: ABC transporter substrate-binding protein [Alphaproteobacteria bacterium]|nr:ABC transporter substrate-binding protein [Alphaproteobacteria bacterium]
MKNKKLLIIGGIIVTVAITIFAFQSRREIASDKPVIKIGVIAPLTGDNANVGQNCKRGIEFAIANLSNSSVRYKMILEDSRFQSSTAVSAAHKLISKDNVDILFACESPSGSAVAPIADKAGKLMMTIFASAQEVAVGYKHSFLHWTSPNAEMAKAVELFNKNKVKKLLIFEQNHSGTKALGDALREELAGTKIEYKTSIIMSDERNFGDIVAKAQAEKADGYMIIVLPPPVNMLIKKLNEVGDTTKRYSVEVPALVEDKSIFEGVEFADVYEGTPEILDAYRTKYKTDNVYGVAFAFDGMMMIDKVISDWYRVYGTLPTGTEISESLLKLENWNGAVGSVKIDNEGRIHSKAVIKVIKNGKPEIVK